MKIGDIAATLAKKAVVNAIYKEWLYEGHIDIEHAEMTREEAIAVLAESKWQNEVMRDNPSTFWASHQMADGVKNAKRRIEALDVALSALRPVSREQVEKVWRGEWMGSGDGYADGELVYDTWECSHCGHVIDEEDDPDMLPQFCPKCYAAMTDEAVEMVLERLEEMRNG